VIREPDRALLVSLSWFILSSGIGIASCSADGGWQTPNDRAFDVPSATLQITHSAVPATSPERDRLRVELDSAFSTRFEEAARSHLRSPSGVAVDNWGRIYVYDTEGYRILVFDPSGRLINNIGGKVGQGPGAFGRGGMIAVDGERLIYIRSWGRMSVWNLDGVHLLTRQFGRLPVVNTVEGAQQATGFVGAYRRQDMERNERSVARISVDGDVDTVYTTVEDPGEVALTRFSGTSGIRMSTGIRNGEPGLAVSPESMVYISDAQEYEVLAVTVAGEPVWRLTVAWDRITVTEDAVREAMRRVHTSFPDAEQSEIDWPSFHPALSIEGIAPRRLGSPIRVDGLGRLYVFPLPDVSDLEAGELRPVDVYRRDGGRILAGVMPTISWLAAFKDWIYGLEETEDGRLRVVRYRIGPLPETR